MDKNKKELQIIPFEIIEKRIFIIRGQKVMLSMHLAEIYSVEPRVLIQSIKRNINRFPEDFMFQLNEFEFENLKSQIVTSSWGGLRRARPYAFTEHGIAMLSSVLNSDRAIQMNIFIIRAFVRLREIISTHKDLLDKMEELEREQKDQGEQISVIYSIVKKLIDEPIEDKNRIGFNTED